MTHLATAVILPARDEAREPTRHGNIRDQHDRTHHGREVMRFSPTRAEEWLWRCLSGSKTGFAFRRQLVIGHFIVDFACTKARLAVETDGASHDNRPHDDARRNRILAELGWQGASCRAAPRRPVARVVVVG